MKLSKEVAEEEGAGEVKAGGENDGEGQEDQEESRGGTKMEYEAANKQM